MTEPDPRALRIIRMRDDELAKVYNFRNLYQEAADLTNPRENQITTKRAPGEDISAKYLDDTAVQDLQILGAGIITSMMPPGQEFFGLRPDPAKDEDTERNRRYLRYLAQHTHDRMFSSNLSMQINETVLSTCGLGTGCLFTGWDNRIGRLMYKDYDISLFMVKQDDNGRVDTVIVCFQLSARNALRKYGDRISGEAKEAAADLQKESKRFSFIWIVRPTESASVTRNPRWRYEGVTVEEGAKQVVLEEGFSTFPFGVPRWRLSASSEKYGRGQSVVGLGSIRQINKMADSRIRLANRVVEPPLEVKSIGVEGRPDIRPNKLNYVMEMGSIRGIDMGALGQYPYMEDSFDKMREQIHDLYFRKAFRLFSDMADKTHITTMQLRAAASEGLKLMAQPIARLQNELFDPMIQRSVQLLIDWGQVEPPPPGLTGYNIDYLGQLALALRDQRATGFVQFVSVLAGISQFKPDAMDVVNFDRALPALAESWGVDVDHMATEDELAEARQQRAAQAAAEQARLNQESAAKAYKASTAAPEQGSPAQELMASGIGA